MGWSVGDVMRRWVLVLAGRLRGDVALTSAGTAAVSAGVWVEWGVSWALIVAGLVAAVVGLFGTP